MPRTKNGLRRRAQMKEFSSKNIRSIREIPAKPRSGSSGVSHRRLFVQHAYPVDSGNAENPSSNGDIATSTSLKLERFNKS